MKVFLTGGTGFIGQRLTRELVAKGWNVVAQTRRPDSPQGRALTRAGATSVAGEVTDRESMREAMAGADLVVHNAGHYEVGVDAAARERMEATNVVGTRTVLDLAHALGIPRTLYVSSVWAYGASGPDPRDETHQRFAAHRSHYERTKADAHDIAREYQKRGLPVIIACPNGVIGPNDHSVWGYFLRLYLNKLLPPMAWSPQSIVALVDVNDVARGIGLAAEKARSGETYMFSGEPKTLREHIGFWARAPGALFPRVWLPSRLAALMFWTVEPLQRAVGLPAFMSRETVWTGATHLNYSSEKAKRELGWSHRSAGEMWASTIEGERALLKMRTKRDLVSRLRPVASDTLLA